MRSSLASVGIAWVLAALMAGCVTPEPLPVEDVQLGIRVLGAHIWPGRCVDDVTEFGDVCHALIVEVDNGRYVNPRDVSAVTWKAMDGAGRIHTHPITSSDSIPGGERGTVNLGFTMQDGPARLANVLYETFGARGGGKVPTY
jgi:hypothetical protein